MVKVLQCHNFRSKKVIPIQDEPLAICANGSQLFVATRRCSVVVFSLPKENHDDIQEKRRFDTVSLVDKLLFSSASMLYGIINLFLIIWDYSDQVTTRPRTAHPSNETALPQCSCWDNPLPSNPTPRSWSIINRSLCPLLLLIIYIFVLHTVDVIDQGI